MRKIEACQPVYMTEEEQEVQAYIDTNHPHLQTKWEQSIQDGRNGIMERLLASLIREKIEGAEHYIPIHKKDGIWQKPPTLPSGDFSAIGEIEDKLLYVDTVFTWKIRKYRIFVPIKGMFAFDRVLPTPPYYIDQNDKLAELLHPCEIMDLFTTPSPSLQSFSRDLANSSANLALTYTFGHGEKGRQLYSYKASEQSVQEGHPIHPAAKMRKGLSPADHVRYASEFRQEFSIGYVAVHKDLSLTPKESENWTQDLFREVKGLESCLAISVHDPVQYDVIPVHPWQLRNTIPRLFHKEISLGTLVILPIETPDYAAGLSFRTIIPKESSLPHLKLPVDIHLTGEVRTLSEQTIHNGPYVSNVFHHLIANDEAFDTKSFVLLKETGGIQFNSSDPLQTEMNEQLSCLKRENVSKHIQRDEIALVGSSLFSNYSDSKKIIDELIMRYHLTLATSSMEGSILSFVKTYTKLLVPPLLHLFVKYGVALEGHLQNTIPVFTKKGVPVKILIRDWEGIRIDCSRWEQAGLTLTEFHPTSRILTNHLNSARNKLFYSVIQNHVGELLLHLARSYRIGEADLWELVRQEVTNTLCSISRDPAYEERARADEKYFTSSSIDYKAITWMRMIGEAHDYTYTKVKNPLNRSVKKINGD